MPRGAGSLFGFVLGGWYGYYEEPPQEHSLLCGGSSLMEGVDLHGSHCLSQNQISNATKGMHLIKGYYMESLIVTDDTS